MNLHPPVFTSLRLLFNVIAAVFLLLYVAAPVVQSQTDPEAIETGLGSAVVTNNPAPPSPALNIVAKDNPNDDGGAISVTWELSPDDNGSGNVKGYNIYRSTSPDGAFELVGEAVRGATSAVDNKAESGIEYFYRVDVYYSDTDINGQKTQISAPSVLAGPVKATAQFFNTDRFWCLVLVLIMAAAIIFFIQKAKSGQDIYVRKIAGIDAVEEAVGRATEMGRKVFFIPGIQDMNDVQTIAGIAILGRVAALAAEYETWLEVPVSKSMVMVTARETMKEAYTRVGRPDAFREAQVHYVTDDQFGYAAAIDGMIVREKPATIFYMGAFFAESLILAETGNAAGAIQIAGTAMPSQLPFFVAACDYTLIGEELFAASAYLSREPRQLGSLKGQDVGKVIFLVAIIAGIILATAGIYDLSHFFVVK